MPRRYSGDTRWLLYLIEQLDRTDPSELPEVILRAMLERWGLSGGWIIWMEDEPAGAFSLAAAIGLPPELEAEDQALLRWSPCRCQGMALRGELSEATHLVQCERMELAGLPTAHLVIPLRSQGHLYGVMNLLVPPDFQLKKDTQQILTLAGQLCGALIGHRRALHRLQKQYERLEHLSRIAQQANELLPLEDLLGYIIREIVTLLHGDRGAIALMAETRDHLRVVAEYNPIGTSSNHGVPIPISGNPSMAWILRERRPLPIADVAGNPILGPMEPMLRAMGVRSLMIVPMIVGSRIIGTLEIDSVQQARAFTPEEIRLAETLAAQVAGAVERARLLVEAQRRAAHLEMLHVILQEATEAQDLGELMDHALIRICAAFGIPWGWIWLKGHAVFHGLPSDLGSQIATIARAAGLELHETLAVADWAALPADHPLSPLQDVMQRLGIRASITVSLWCKGQHAGGLSIADLKPRDWQPEEIALIQTIARELGTAVERLQLLKTLQVQADRLHVLYQTARALTRLQPLPALLDQALAEILNHLPADAASVYVRDPDDSNRLRLVAYRGFSLENARYFDEYNLRGEGKGPSITIQAFLQGESVWVERIEDFPYTPETRAVILRDGIRSFIATPLFFRDENLGVLNVAWRTYRTFDPEVRSLLQGLADLLAAGIHSARLLERTQRQAHELAALNQALSETLRLREEMIQNVSHELRTPLAVATGYLELLADGALGPLNLEQQEAIVVSRERLKELHRYVELLLTLQATRAREMVRIPIDLKRLVEEILCRWRIRLDPKRYPLEVQLPEEGLWLIGDPERLAQAIGEVLDNAVKFSPGGGKSEIALGAEEGQVVLRVRDEGIGIPEEHLSRIGEPFYQVEGGTTRRFPGMGIGLTVARAVAEAHGGKLIVRLRAPRGTEVAFVLPFARLA